MDDKSQKLNRKVVFLSSALFKANYVSTWLEKLRMQLLCPVKVGLLQQLFVVHDNVPVTETTASPEHCCKNCHSNKEVRAHHFFFSLS